MQATNEKIDPLVLAAEAELAKREMARRYFRYFVRKVFKEHYGVEYMMGFVHEIICNELDAFLDDVINKRSPRLIITMPPRSGKSELFSRLFPPYVFGRRPNINYISASFSPDLAKRMNRDVQRIIDSQVYNNIFPETTLNSKRVVSDNKSNFVRNTVEFEIVNKKGSYRGVGCGSPINGMGCDILGIDDPIKDRATAESTTLREKIHDWFTSTAYTRLTATGGLIIGNTRWHVDDLSGRLVENQKKGGETYKVINFPAIAEHDEEYNGKIVRRAGEALHPERFDLKRLETIKNVIGDRDWNSLYQQNPILDGGNLFKGDWFRYYNSDNMPRFFEYKLMSWDLTFKKSPISDFVACTVWGVNGGNMYLIDALNERMSFTESIDAFIAMCAKHPDVTTKLIEDKANGSAAIDVLTKKGIGGIIGINPIGKKEIRANRVTPFFRTGNIVFPDPEFFPLIKKIVGQLIKFPNDTHDDIVDTITQAIEHAFTTQVDWSKLYG